MAYKLGGLIDGRWQAWRKPNRWSIERAGDAPRIVIAPAAESIALLDDLAAAIPEPLYLLYVLMVPRRGERDPWRYQSADVLSRLDVHEFLSANRRFLEEDGRHYLWVGSPSGDGLLVYDNHDMIYGYGHVGAYAKTCLRRGLIEGEVSLPSRMSRCTGRSMTKEKIG